MPRGVKREDGKNAHAVASDKYNAQNYERVFIRVRKGCKEQLQEYCQTNDISLNKLVIDSINKCTGLEIK